MNRIMIIGAGVMGGAIAIPASDHADNKVTLVGSPLDDAIIDSINQAGTHPTLKLDYPRSVRCIKLAELQRSDLSESDIVIMGVSSPGIPWLVELLQTHNVRPPLLSLVTKGLVAHDSPEQPPLTYADALPPDLSDPVNNLVGIGGPCIARELALKIPTRVTYASRDTALAKRLRDCFQTDYYRITTSDDIVGVEACAALKNFLCIGVSAMFSRYPLDDSHAKNPVAGLYNQAVMELSQLSRWIKSSEFSQANQATVAQNPVNCSASNDVAFDLAGMGDLHVTVGGGRNSRLGKLLGRGTPMNSILSGEMQGVTVEGVDTGRQLAAGFHSACERGALDVSRLPLTASILKAIEQNRPFSLDFRDLPD